MSATSFFGGEFFGGEFFNASSAATAPADGGVKRVRLLGELKRLESEPEKLERRIREGTLVLPVAPTVEQGHERAAEYAAKSARLAAGIARFRAEAEASRQAIARLEAAQVKRETAKLRRDLIRAQQALQLAQVQEAALLEEMEMLDVAFVAAVALGVTLQ